MFEFRQVEIAEETDQGGDDTAPIGQVPTQETGFVKNRQPFRAIGMAGRRTFTGPVPWASLLRRLAAQQIHEDCSGLGIATLIGHLIPLVPFLFLDRTAALILAIEGAFRVWPRSSKFPGLGRVSIYPLT